MYFFLAEIDAFAINNSRSDILEMCSESESDVEVSTCATVWPDVQADSSDNESIDSDQEDLLKYIFFSLLLFE